MIAGQTASATISPRCSRCPAIRPDPSIRRNDCADLAPPPAARGVRAAGGGAWSAQSLRRMLGSGRIAGQREHRGEIVADAVWPAIIAAELSATIRAMLADPERRTNRGARRYL